MNNKILILFSKWPVNGCSKTRIMKAMGENDTEKFCFACLGDIISKIKTLHGVDTVVVSDRIEDSVSFASSYNIRALSLEEMNIEKNTEKGAMFHKIFDYFLKEYSKAILIPMDVPHLNMKTIHNAFSRLDSFDQVYGPESNGGVYLMGIKKLTEKTFKEVRWSTQNSCMDLLNNSLSCFLMESSFDINNIEDLRLLSLSDLQSCPHLARFIKSSILSHLSMKKEVLVT